MVAGATTVEVHNTKDFFEGMDVVIGAGTPEMEFNKIRKIGTIEFATPLKNHHPAGTKISQKQAQDTTTIGKATTTVANPCGVVTTTEKNPCGVITTVVTTTEKNPCGVI